MSSISTEYYAVSSDEAGPSLAPSDFVPNTFGTTPRLERSQIHNVGCLGIVLSVAINEAGLHSFTMHYVYVLESKTTSHWYIGVTNDLRRRLYEHNSGKSVHTNKYRPWKIRLYVTFENRNQAEEFEKYLKSHSGRAFMSKHL